MKTIIKLLIAAAIINASARVGMAAWRYYELKDAAQQVVLFGANTPIETLQGQIVEKARELVVPVPPEKVIVQREGGRTWAEASYTHPIEVFPSYTYPFDFSFSVEGFSVAGGTR